MSLNFAAFVFALASLSLSFEMKSQLSADDAVPSGSFSSRALESVSSGVERNFVNKFARLKKKRGCEKKRVLFLQLFTLGKEKKGMATSIRSTPHIIKPAHHIPTHRRSEGSVYKTSKRIIADLNMNKGRFKENKRLSPETLTYANHIRGQRVHVK